MSLLSKISYFVWTGKVHFQLREHYFQKAGFFDSLKCSLFSFNSGHFKEMILLGLKNGANNKAKLEFLCLCPKRLLNYFQK